LYQYCHSFLLSIYCSVAVCQLNNKHDDDDDDDDDTIGNRIEYSTKKLTKFMTSP